MIKLNTEELFEIGSYISKRLIKDNVTENAKLEISVDGESFKKIDEDIFYTLKKQNILEETAEFMPSNNTLELTFPKLNILINTKD